MHAAARKQSPYGRSFLCVIALLRGALLKLLQGRGQSQRQRRLSQQYLSMLSKGSLLSSVLKISREVHLTKLTAKAYCPVLTGVQHREDMMMTKDEAEKHHQVALLVNKAPDKADDKVRRKPGDLRSMSSLIIQSLSTFWERIMQP